MRHSACHIILLRQLHAGDRFTHSADLIDFNQRCRTRLSFDGSRETCNVCHKEIVTNQKYVIANSLTHRTPSIPIIFAATIKIDVDNRRLATSSISAVLVFVFSITQISHLIAYH